MNRTMDVSQRYEDSIRGGDLFDLVACEDYELMASDLTSLDDLVTKINNNNNIGEDIMGPNWSCGPYQNNVVQQNVIMSNNDKEKNASDKMWGGGATTEKVVNTTFGAPIYITFPEPEPIQATGVQRTVTVTTQQQQQQQPDTSDSSTHIPSPPTSDLFPTMLTEKPFDVLVSDSHRSPGSDCVSFVSAESGCSDSGIDTTSPIPHTEPVDFDRLIDTAMDGLPYSPSQNGGLTGLSAIEETKLLENNGYIIAQAGGIPYISSTINANSESILEGALRGTVRRLPIHQSQQNGCHVRQETKTLTVMNNMTPLPPITAFKQENMGLPPSQPQISSSNGVYEPNYDYVPSSDDYTTLESSFPKLSTASSSTKDSDVKPKKRKYTKRGAADEPTSKGRLLHFCQVCQKGFKDKYSVNVHHRTHTGEKPFNCEICGKCFRQKAHLAKHVQIHQNSNGKPGKR